jgi:hypothetical protein
MTECLVNDAPWAVDFRPETWGDLLERLDRTLGAERRVVTAVRFDGVDAPSFRGPAQTGRRLDAVARVEVEADTAGGLLAGALAAASDSLGELQAAARQTAAAYREGDPAAPSRLAAVVGAVQSLVALTRASAHAARFVRGWDGDADVAAASASMERALGVLISRHGDDDVAGLAATLESDLPAALAGWKDVLAAIAAGSAA